MKSKTKKRLIGFFIFIVIFLLLIWTYTSSLIGVEGTSIQYMRMLVEELEEQGHIPNFYVVSGKRGKLHNQLLVQFGGAATQSRHLKGEAIDIIVLDVNQDGKANGVDIDILYKILDRKIVGNKGGIGTYKNTEGFFSQQMIHFDCRGHRARWHR